MKILAHNKWGSHCSTLLTIYKALIRSKLDYASFIYNTATKSTLPILDKLRICTEAFRTNPIESLYNITGTCPLNLRRMENSLKFTVNIAQYPQLPCHKQVYQLGNDQQIHLKNKTPQQKSIYLAAETLHPNS